ncbi:hypothetical protein [Sphingomonas morindae]|uniref:DUF962 domain-containing protein n=1 Tax=Sphingomonas morindae TaxID=1541170 RepID=A0ABY4XAJ1_9SPHN|nr:hypothetical protein [Sphingomonas morindae]USI73975.1 hypothetical protein LHA26_05790 [Sphingomonas morindae]
MRRLHFAAESGQAGFRAQLAEQRWDDHRFYHQSLLNQSLHFVSACTFLIAYVLLFTDPALASLLAWGVAMTSRQAGHFFFEPKGFDEKNQVSHAYKEEVKVGYNLARKYVLMGAWGAAPLLLWLQPDLFGMIQAPHDFEGYLRHVGIAWLMLGLLAIALRVAQLTVARDFETGLVWAVKIVTDPFNDFRLYRSAPAQLVKGRRAGDQLAA